MKLTKYQAYLLQQAADKVLIANTWYRRRSVAALAAAEFLKRFGVVPKGIHKGKLAYRLTDDGKQALTAYNAKRSEQKRIRKQDALALVTIFVTILAALLQYLSGKG